MSKVESELHSGAEYIEPFSQAGHADVTERFTRLLAASTVTDPAFPAEHLLPRMASIPFNNLGHQSLVDQILLGRLLWNTFYNIREKNNKRKFSFKAVFVSVATAGALLTLFWMTGLPVLAVISSAVAAFVAYNWAVDPFKYEAAEVKADAARRMILGEEPAGEFEIDLSQAELAEAGSGLLSPEQALVFFSDDRGRRFPGLGWVNAEELFVCPTKTLSADKTASPQSIATAIQNALADVAVEAKGGTISTGLALVVDSRTVKERSVWLDAESRPILHIRNPPADDLLSLDEMDDQASARTYFGMQVLLPEYLTLASIFVRPFMASTSAAFEITVTTLGPPMNDEKDVLSALHIHERKLIERKRKSWALGRSNDGSLKVNKLGHVFKLKNLRDQWEKVDDPFAKKSDYGLLDDHKWVDPDELSEELEEANKLAEAMGGWVGRFIGEPNWREANSLTVTQDYFGTTECRAAIRALYDQVARHVLAALDEEGFDISQYRDSSGKWSISVDKIDQMIVGEKISVQAAQKKKEENSDGEKSAET